MADTDIFLYYGEVIEEDIILADPTMARGDEEPPADLIRNGVSIGPYLII